MLILPEHVATEGEGYLLDAHTFQPNLCPKVQSEYINVCCHKIQAAYKGELLADCKVKATIKHEARVHQVELNSGAHSNMHDFDHEMRVLRGIQVRIAREMALIYISAGASPVTFLKSPIITPQPRYMESLRKLKGVFEAMQDFDPCASHFHVEVLDEEERVRLMIAIQEFLWLILGLTLSSPITAGVNSGYHSTRLQAWEKFPNSGIYKGPAKNKAEWDAYIEAQKAIGEAEDATTMWYWVRACCTSKQPTLETRVGDAITHVEDIAPIAALVMAIKRFLQANPERVNGDPSIAEANLNAVSQHGRLAWVKILRPDGSYESVRFGQAAREILKEMAPYAEEAMGGTAYPYYEKIGNVILKRTAVSSTILNKYHEALAEDDSDGAHAERAVVEYLAYATAKDVT